jgi:hypothetical protein
LIPVVVQWRAWVNKYSLVRPMLIPEVHAACS